MKKILSINTAAKPRHMSGQRYVHNYCAAMVNKRIHPKMNSIHTLVSDQAQKGKRFNFSVLGEAKPSANGLGRKRNKKITIFTNQNKPSDT